MTPTISSVQTFINQIHQEGFTPLSELEGDPFWDSLVPASGLQGSNNEEIANDISSTPGLGKDVLEEFDIQDFKSHIKG